MLYASAPVPLAVLLGADGVGLERIIPKGSVVNSQIGKVPGVLFTSAFVPPAVLPAASLTSLFGGPPQLDPPPSVHTRPTTMTTRWKILFMVFFLLFHIFLHFQEYQTSKMASPRKTRGNSARHEL